jgi:hypothetical protein
MGCKAGFCYNPNKHITYHFMSLFDSKLYETFPGVTIDRYKGETHEDIAITPPKHTFLKRAYM